MTNDPFFGRSRSDVAIVDRPRSKRSVAAPRSHVRTLTRDGRGASPAMAEATASRPAPVDRSRSGRRRKVPSASPRGPRLGPPRGRTTDDDPRRDRRRTKTRLGVFIAFVLLAVAAVGARLVDVQVVKPDRYVAYGLGQRDGYRVLAAGRGSILDRRGQPFAISVAQPQVVADPTQAGDRAEVNRTTDTLAQVLNLDRAPVHKALAQSDSARRYVVLDGSITPKQAARVKAERLPGIAIEERYVRSNPSEGLGSAVVGRALPDGQKVKSSGGQGVSGVEAQYDRELTGTVGRRYFERDPQGNTIAGGRQRTVAARPGTDLYLTLDQVLQYETEQALTDQVKVTGAQGAMAVVMHPSTGEVLSMASVERGTDDTIAPTSDVRPVTAVFEPGSVNKVVTIAGAIQDRTVAPDTVLDVPDHLQIYDRTFNDHEPHPDARWSVTDILVTSSNIGTIKVAQQLGKARVDRYLRAFGFGRSTGLGVNGESAGLLRSLDKWSGVDIGSMPIGQGISVTALQMLSTYNTIANGGVYVAPKLVAATDDGHGRTPTKPSARRQVVSSDTAAAVQDMLCKVVTDGTGKRAAIPGYRSCGKTGTARIPQGNKDQVDGYEDAAGRYQYYSTFVGTVDGADLSVIVTVREAQTSIYGSEVAAPVFSQLAAMALRRYQIPPPDLVAAGHPGVPELSASARDVQGEDVTADDTPAAG